MRISGELPGDRVAASRLTSPLIVPKPITLPPLTLIGLVALMVPPESSVVPAVWVKVLVKLVMAFWASTRPELVKIPLKANVPAPLLLNVP